MIPPSKKQISKTIRTLEGMIEQHKSDEEYYEQRPVEISTMSRIDIFLMAINELEKESK